MKKLLLIAALVCVHTTYSVVDLYMAVRKSLIVPPLAFTTKDANEKVLLSEKVGSACNTIAEIVMDLSSKTLYQSPIPHAHQVEMARLCTLVRHYMEIRKKPYSAPRAYTISTTTKTTISPEFIAACESNAQRLVNLLTKPHTEAGLLPIDDAAHVRHAKIAELLPIVQHYIRIKQHPLCAPAAYITRICDGKVVFSRDFIESNEAIAKQFVQLLIDDARIHKHASEGQQ